MSSRIEGTQADLEDAALYEAAPRHEADDAREVNNYEQALGLGLELVQQRPVGQVLYQKLHERLMQGGDSRSDPGNFRRIQNWIGPEGLTIAEARYIPPPVPQMHQRLDDLDNFINQPSEIPDLMRLAMVHYQFEAIHPFIDGNGRIGRLLITLLMAQWGILTDPPLYLSRYLERHRQDYYDHLLAVSRNSAWAPWLCFILTGLGEQAEDMYRKARKLVELRYHYEQDLKDHRNAGPTLQLLDQLFARQAITVSIAADLLEVTFNTASNHVQRLVDIGALKEVPVRGRSRVFLATEVFRVIRG